MQSKSIAVIAGALVFLCLFAVAVFVYFGVTNKPAQPASPEKLSAQTINKEGGQAVFLTNGQVYFGKLEMYEDAYKLKNVYYFDSEAKPVKLGDEPHKPKDEMFILKDQVLFWENLREDALGGKLNK